MNKVQRNAFLVTGAVVAAALIFYAGFATGANPRFSTWTNSIYTGMMGRFYGDADQAQPYGMGMMGGRYGFGMMGAYDSELAPLSLQEAEEAVQEYLAGLSIEGLALGEIMIFDNHAYAQILEADSGIGAMEVLVDPVTRIVYPEHGPNMMWNLKYSLMGAGMMEGGYGMMGMMLGDGYGMMGNYRAPSVFNGISADLTINPEEALSLASDYLADNLPDYTVADEADAFYGYYTLHILNDGEITGMLSVNGLTGQVFLHTWHGAFIEMSHE